MAPSRIEAGTEFRLPPRVMSRERMRWYVDGQPTIAADDGRIHTQPPTIYEDHVILTCIRVKSVTADATGANNYDLEVWCEDAAGKTVTTGEAQVCAPA